MVQRKHFWLIPLLLLSLTFALFLKLSPSGKLLSDSSVSVTDAVSQQGEDSEKDGKDDDSFAFDSDPQLDPVADKTFLISVVVRFHQLPRPKERQKIVYKYSRDIRPYPGWALTVKSFGTHFRPEVYWQGLKGKGGWYTLGEIDIGEGQSYSISLLAREGQFLSGYIERLPEPGEKNAVNLKVQREASFVGGYDVSKTKDVRSDKALGVRSGYLVGKRGQIEVSQLIIAQLDFGPQSIEDAKVLLSGGPMGLQQKLPTASVKLLFLNGEDRSQYGRKVLGAL